MKYQLSSDRTKKRSLREPEETVESVEPGKGEPKGREIQKSLYE